MAQFPCLPLWTDAWVADTRHLSYAKRGLYHDLLVLMWRCPGCRVPNDDAWLANRLNLSGEEVAQVLRPVIAEFCQTDGNWVTQKRLKKEYVYCFERAGRLSDLAKRRWRKKKGASGSRNAADAILPNPTLNKKEDLLLGESEQAPAVEKPPQTLAELNKRWHPAAPKKRGSR